MIGTSIAFIIALIGVLIPAFFGSVSENNSLIRQLLLIPLFSVFVQMIFFGFTLSPFQKVEKNFSPRILELFKQDHWMTLINGGLIFVALLSILCSFNIEVLQRLHPLTPLIALLFLVGISFDLLHFLFKRVLGYLNPFAAAKMLTKAAEKSIELDRGGDLCNWTEALSEVAVKSLHLSSSSLCTQAVDEIREVLSLFLQASKSLAHENVDKQSQELGIKDKVSYTLFFFLDRMEMIYKKALELKIEPVCSTIVTTLGKMTIDAAKCDLSLTSAPVHSIGKFCCQAEKSGLPDVALKGSCTLFEVARTIVNEIDLTYLELQEPFHSIILQLDEIAKETFRQDKNSNIKFLTQSLQDLKSLFQSEKMSAHQDTSAIMDDLNRCLAEWETLEVIMRTIPPIPPVEGIKNPAEV